MLHVLRLAPTELGAARTHAREQFALPPRHAARTRSTAPVASEAQSLVGRVLGDRYRVVELLGTGGMGAVYRAFDRVLDEDVALKIVRGDRADLREEVRLAQQVTHRNVCRTYDLEAIDGHHFVKMEYIAGESLASHLARTGPLPAPRVLAITRAIADGLAAAHARGIVHRDLKPGNVMLDGERVVIVDFGLAQREGASDSSGTPAYMSPEQLASGAVDARSDLFALGCVVYEMLAGVPPFGDGTIADIVARQRQSPDVRELPRPLARAVTDLLARDPALRVRGLAALDARRRWHWLAIAPLALVAMVVAAAARPAPAWEPRVADLPAYDENADEPVFAPDGRAFAFSSDRGHRDRWAIYAAVDGAEPRQISRPDRSCVGARWTRDGAALLMSCTIDDGERHIVRQPTYRGPERDLGPGWSVDDCGDALAVVVTRGTGAAIVLRDAHGRDVDVVAVPGVTFVRCDRDGSRIAYVEGPLGHPGFGGDLVVVDRFGHTRRLASDVDSAAFTPDGTIVFAMQQRDGGSSLFEIAATGGPVHELAPHEHIAAAPDVARDGSALIYDRDQTSIPLFELTPNGEVQRTYRAERLTHVVADPAGRVLVATRHERHALSIVAIDVADFSERLLAPGEALLVSRAGDVVLHAADDPRCLQAVSLRGGAPTTIATLPAPIVGAADGPDGIHVELERDGRNEAWLVGRDGSMVPEGVAGLVMPAPAGGWRVVVAQAGMAVTLRFVPPSGAPAFERTAMWGQPAWVGDHELAYCDASACHRFDVVARRDVATMPVDAPHRPITASGTRWFATSYLGHVTRHVIVNFAERPWH